MAPARPIAFAVGVGVDSSVSFLISFLSGAPEAFERLAQTEGLTLETATDAADYARVWLEATRPVSDHGCLVESADDVKFRPSLGPAEQALRDRFLRHYRSIVGPVSASPDKDDYRVTAYFVRDQALERHDLGVQRDGVVHPAVSLVEAELPVVYVS
jgi:hypothetical protein